MGQDRLLREHDASETAIDLACRFLVPRRESSASDFEKEAKKTLIEIDHPFFNARLCATLDPRPFETAIDREKAALAAADAELVQGRAGLTSAQADLERKTALLKRRAISRRTLDAARRTVTRA